MSYRVKVLLAGLTMITSVSAFAASECPLWVFKPYKKCSDPANGYIVSQRGSKHRTGHYIGPFSSGKDDIGQPAECGKSVDAKNTEEETTGLHYTFLGVDPSKEKNEKDGINRAYSYWCIVDVQSDAVKPTGSACGQEDNYSAKVGPEQPVDAPKDIKCLSCDNLSGDINAEAKCLVDNVKTFALDKGADTSRIDYRDDDWKKVTANVNAVIENNKRFGNAPVLNDMSNMDVLSKYLDTKK